MAYDPELAQRLRDLLGDEPDVTEKRMFGGLAFLTGGHLAVAASGQGGLMVRCDLEDTEPLVAEPHARPMVMRGKPTRGWVRVDAAGVAEPEDLAGWVWPAVAFARAQAG